MKTCNVGSCDKKAKTKHWCEEHHKAWKRYKDRKPKRPGLQT